MNARKLAYLTALTRVGIGGVLTAAPAAGRLWAGSAAASRGGQMIVRGLGIRDLLIGLGMVNALRQDEPLALWAWFAVVCDSVDGAATAGAIDELPFPGWVAAPLFAAVVATDLYVAAAVE